MVKKRMDFITFYREVLKLSLFFPDLSNNFSGPKDTLRIGRGDTFPCNSFLFDLAGLDQAQL